MEAGLCWCDQGNGVWFWIMNGVPRMVTHCFGCGRPLPVMWKLVERTMLGDSPIRDRDP